MTRFIRLCSLLLILVLLLPQLVIAAPQNWAGGETGAAGDEMNAATGLTAMVTSPVKSGTYSYDLKATTSGNSGIQFRCISATGAVATCNIATAWNKADIQFLSLPNVTQGSSVIAHWEDNSFNPKAELWIDSNGHLILKNNAGTTLSTGTTVLTTGTWYQIEIKLATGASAAYEVKINGTSEFTGTGNLATGGQGQVIWGPRTNLTNGTFEFYADDIVVDDAAYPGSLHVKRQAPLAAGSTQVCVNEAGGASPAISKISDIPAVNTTYWKTTGGAGDVCLFTLATTGSSGISGTVAGAKAWIQQRLDSAGTASLKIRIRESATNSDDTGLAITTSDTNRFLILTTKPSGGAWTTTALDSTEMGSVEANAVVSRMNDASMLVLSDNAATATPTPTSTPTSTPTNTPTNTPTATPTSGNSILFPRDWWFGQNLDHAVPPMVPVG